MRKPLESFAQFGALTAGMTANSNAFFPHEVKQYIEKHRASYMASGDVLAVYFSEMDYERIVLYSRGPFTPDIPGYSEIVRTDGLPLSCELTCRRGVSPNADLTFLLALLGFHLTYVFNEYELHDSSSFRDYKAPEDGTWIGPAKKEHISGVRKLWAECLPAYSVPYIDQSEMEQLVDSGSLLVAVDEEGKLRGCQYSTQYMGKVKVNHLAVDPVFRNRWLGIKIACQQLSSLRNGESVTGWIDQRNVVSITLHEWLGFRKTGRKTYQYILNQ